VKLQVNTNGAWKDIAEFADGPTHRAEVIKALQALMAALGPGKCKWCLVDDKGNREWLKFP
jgi:hypothetical protein